MTSSRGSHKNGHSRAPLLVLGLALAVAAALATAPAATAQAEELTIRSSASSITFGNTIVVRGKLSPQRSGRTVALQYKPAGREYETVAKRSTDEEGRYRFEIAPRFTGRVRAVIERSPEEDLRSDYVKIAVAATISARAKKHVLRSNGVVARGRVLPQRSGRTVLIDQRKHGDWERVARTTTARDGTYRASWRPSLGSYDVRARVRGDDLNGGAKRWVDHRVHVYRSAHASWYGPGLYGNRTACGQTLRRDTFGVAHKKLPCGTRVRFYYRGRTARVPVIDRGPFVAGREWDLTQAAKERLGFPDVDSIWSTR